MDDSQRAYFFERYSRMSNEELSYLVVSRGDSLSEEASDALRTVLAGRNSDDFKNELRATASDVGAQIRHAEEEAKKQAKNARGQRTALRVVCCVFVIAGIMVAVFGMTEQGWALGVVGVALFLYLELKRLIWRFVAALFNPNSS